VYHSKSAIIELNKSEFERFGNTLPPSLREVARRKARRREWRKGVLLQHKLPTTLPQSWRKSRHDSPLKEGAKASVYTLKSNLTKEVNEFYEAQNSNMLFYSSLLSYIMLLY